MKLVSIQTAISCTFLIFKDEDNSEIHMKIPKDAKVHELIPENFTEGIDYNVSFEPKSEPNE